MAQFHSQCGIPSTVFKYVSSLICNMRLRKNVNTHCIEVAADQVSKKGFFHETGWESVH